MKVERYGYKMQHFSYYYPTQISQKQYLEVITMELINPSHDIVLNDFRDLSHWLNKTEDGI